MGGAKLKSSRVSLNDISVLQAELLDLTDEGLTQLYISLILKNRGPEGREHSARVSQRALRPISEECGEGQFEFLLFNLRARGAINTHFQLLSLALPAAADLKKCVIGRAVVRYTLDRVRYPDDAIRDQQLPSSDIEIKLPNGTSIGLVRADLGDLPGSDEVPPIYVQRIGLAAEYALGRYLDPPFSMPDPRKGRQTIELLICGLKFFGMTKPDLPNASVPFDLLIDNDLTAAQSLATVPHELFHRVQYCYNEHALGELDIRGAVREGGARLVEDCLINEFNRYVLDASSLFDSSRLSLLEPKQNRMPYATGLFWRYISEQHCEHSGGTDDPALSIDAYRKILQATAAPPSGEGYDARALRVARDQMPWYGRFDEFRFLDDAQNELISHETTWGNFILAKSLHHRANPQQDPRFDFAEDNAQVKFPGSGDQPSLVRLSALKPICEEIILKSGRTTSYSGIGLDPLSARHYRIFPGPGTEMGVLKVHFQSDTTLSDPLVQIIQITTGNSGEVIADISRTGSGHFVKTVDLNGLAEVIVVVGGRMTGGSYDLSFGVLTGASDVMITRWNTAAGTEYEVDPRGWSWTWTSPDIWASSPPIPGRDTVLNLRIRNKGNVEASGISIALWQQKAAPCLDPTAWRPVLSAGGAVQAINGATLAAKGSPGAEGVFSVNWAPLDDGTDASWCIKAVVASPGDANTHNKLALCNLIRPVDAHDGLAVRQLIRHSSHCGGNVLRVFPHGPHRTFSSNIALSGNEFDAGAPVAGSVALGEIMPSPDRVAQAELSLVSAEAFDCWSADAGSGPPPAGYWYTANPLTLPPGADPKQLITVAQFVQGAAVGGVTFEI